MKEFSKAAEYKIGIQTSIAFILTNNKQLQDLMIVKPHLKQQQRESNTQAYT